MSLHFNDISNRAFKQPPYIVSRIASLRSFLSVSRLLRLSLVGWLLLGYVLTCWSLLVNPAYAATRTAGTSHAVAQALQSALSTQNTSSSPQGSGSFHPRNAAPLVSSSMPFDGLGVLPFYTYITLRLDDRTELQVNVANGNLVAHTSDLHLRGTGIDETLDGYYNSQASLSGDHGNNWTFSYGHDVRLDLSNPSAGITLHGPSGYSAFFAPNGSSYKDAPGLNATLVYNSSNSTYTLTFHRSGEQWIFGSNSHLAADKDKNGNSISYSYNSSHDLLSLTDSQGRVTSFTHNTVSGFSDPTGQITSFPTPLGAPSPMATTAMATRPTA